MTSADDIVWTEYQCPLCGHKMARDLVRFLDHTNQHVIDKIKALHPEWIESNGACVPCVDYYKKALSGDRSFSNIGPGERKKRIVMGTLLLALSLGLMVYFRNTHASIALRIWLFVPLFMSTFCFVQAKEKTCALLAQKGTQNRDHGEEEIANLEVADILRLRAQKIWTNSLFIALVLTGLFLIFPY